MSSSTIATILSIICEGFAADFFCFSVVSENDEALNIIHNAKEISSIVYLDILIIEPVY
jgi:hypothetical protein